MGLREGCRKSLEWTLQACASCSASMCVRLWGRCFPSQGGPEVCELKVCPWGLSCSGLSSGPVRKAWGEMTLPMKL